LPREPNTDVFDDEKYWGEAMSKKFTIATLGTVSALTLGHAYPVAAQAVDQPGQPSASAANGGDLEEVVVTARRREEKAQTVPLRMTVVSSELLQDLSVQTPGELMMLSPGFNTFVNGQGQATQQYVWMRGITGVTAYFSEVPTNFSGQALYFDLDNIQVLEGPQGTLFGVSSDSGAVLFQPKKPTNDFGGYAQVTLGDYNRHDLDLVANIPIVDDKLMVRVGGQYYHTDGWIKDVVQNKDLNDIDYWNGRISATLRPTDNVENYFVANFFYTDTNGTAYRVDDFNPVGATAKLYAGSLAQYVTEIHQPYGIAYGVPGAIGTIAEQKQLNIADILTWDVNDNITIKNIAGYSEVTTLGRGNAPDMPYPIFVTLSPTASGPLVTYTDEPQLQGKLFNDKFSFVVGGYLLFDHTIDPAPSVSEIFGAKSGTLSSSDERTQAIYLQGTYDLGALLEGLSFTAGYRYSWDYRAAWQQSLNANLVKTGAPLASDGNFHAPNFTFVVNYQVLPETMV
jgi:iron complex outermembrane receptor protein